MALWSPVVPLHAAINVHWATGSSNLATLRSRPSRYLWTSSKSSHAVVGRFVNLSAMDAGTMGNLGTQNPSGSHSPDEASKNFIRFAPTSKNPEMTLPSACPSFGGFISRHSKCDFFSFTKGGSASSCRSPTAPR